MPTIESVAACRYSWACYSTDLAGFEVIQEACYRRVFCSAKEDRNNETRMGTRKGIGMTVAESIFWKGVEWLVVTERRVNEGIWGNRLIGKGLQGVGEILNDQDLKDN